MSLSERKCGAKGFCKGWVLLADDKQPGTPKQVSVTIVTKVDKLIHENWHQSISKVAENFNLNFNAVHDIIKSMMQYWKVYVKWVPHYLKPRSLLYGHVIGISTMLCRWNCKFLVKNYYGGRDLMSTLWIRTKAPKSGKEK